MSIDIRTVEENVTVVTLSNRLDSQQIPKIEPQMSPLAKPDCRVLLDMTAVNYISSAGLRLLLYFSRDVANHGGTTVLVGLREELRDTMEITGFLDFFIVHDTLDAGLAALKNTG